MTDSTINFKLNLGSGAVESFSIPISILEGQSDSFKFEMEVLEKKLEEFGVTIDQVYIKGSDPEGRDEGELVPLGTSALSVEDGNEVELFVIIEHSSGSEHGPGCKKGFFARRREKGKGFLKQMVERNQMLEAQTTEYEGREPPPKPPGLGKLAIQTGRNTLGNVLDVCSIGGSSGGSPGGSNRFSRPGFGGTARPSRFSSYGGILGFGVFRGRGGKRLPGGCNRFSRPGFG